MIHFQKNCLPEMGRAVEERGSLPTSLSCYCGETPLSRSEEELAFMEFARARREVLRLQGICKNVPPKVILESARRRMERCRLRLIKGNLCLVFSIARRFQFCGLPFGDLVNEGNIGLIEAVNRFDVSRGLRFSTYGGWWIRESIRKALSEQGRTVRLPASIQRFARRCLKAEEFLSQKYNRRPHHTEIANYIWEPAERVRRSYGVLSEVMSLDAPLSKDDTTSLAEHLPSKESDDQERRWLHEALMEGLRYLSCRERQIILLRYGFLSGVTLNLRVTGMALGISRERVRQIESRALEKLRKFPSLEAFR